MKTKYLLSKLMLVASLSFIFTVNVSFHNADSFISAYLGIKDALIKTNSKNASLAANGMVSILDGKSDELSKKLLADAKVISASSDVKTQRKHFDTLSQNVYDYVKKTGEKEGTVYKQFCPMAFNNTGHIGSQPKRKLTTRYSEA